jgi:hypothetical protein
MESESKLDRRQHGAAIAVAATLAVAALAVAMMVLDDDIEQPALVDKDQAGAADVSGGAADALAVGATRPLNDGRTSAVTDAVAPWLIECVERANGDPLAGVRLFSNDTSIAGPGDAQGILEVPAEIATTPRADPLTLWVEGWAPVVVRAEALPTEVLFEVATTTVEFTFVNGTADHRILRTLLQPHVPWPPAEGPWAPKFEQQGLDVHRAKGVLPGTYDLFLWVVYPNGEPRPFSSRSLEIKAGETTKVSFDLAAPRDPDEFESDS